MERELFRQSLLYKISYDLEPGKIEYEGFQLHKAESGTVEVSQVGTNIVIAKVRKFFILSLFEPVSDYDIFSQFCSVFQIAPFSYNCDFLGDRTDLTHINSYTETFGGGIRSLRIDGEYKLFVNRCIEDKYNVCINYDCSRLAFANLDKFTTELVAVNFIDLGNDTMPLLFSKIDKEVTKFVILYINMHCYQSIDTSTGEVTNSTGDWEYFVRDYYYTGHSRFSKTKSVN